MGCVCGVVSCGRRVVCMWCCFMWAACGVYVVLFHVGGVLCLCGVVSCGRRVVSMWCCFMWASCGVVSCGRRVVLCAGTSSRFPVQTLPTTVVRLHHRYVVVVQISTTDVLVAMLFRVDGFIGLQLFLLLSMCYVYCRAGLSLVQPSSSCKKREYAF